MTTDLTGLVIAGLDLAAQVDDALAVEAAAFGRESDVFRRDSYLRHTTYAGFAALGAFANGALVGFAYGHTDAPGQWWHDQIANPMHAAGHGGWLGGGFVLVELHVHPAAQRRGLGRRLLTQLLPTRSEPRALLSAHDEETPARRLYRSLGFIDLLTGFHFAGAAPVFAVMGASLPLRAEPDQDS